MAGLALAAVAVAVVLQRRRPEPPSAPSYRTIAEIDRSEFAAPDADLLIVVFGSQTCHTCPEVWDVVRAAAAGRDGVAVERVDVQDDPERHRRYRIDGVPTTVVAERTGIVRGTLFGPVGSERVEELLDAPTG